MVDEKHKINLETENWIQCKCGRLFATSKLKTKLDKFKKHLERAKKTEEAINFVKVFMNENVKHIAIENPVGCLSSVIRKPEQIINPFEFGADASKKTCLWLKNLPKLKQTQYIEPRIVNGKKRWANQTDDGQNQVINSKGKIVGWNTDEIKLLRSKTYPGIAKAMAEQWGKQELLSKIGDEELGGKK